MKKNEFMLFVLLKRLMTFKHVCVFLSNNMSVSISGDTLILCENEVSAKENCKLFQPSASRNIQVL